MGKSLDDIANEAVKRHQQLLCSKVLELVLGEMISLNGISDTRQKLIWYYEHLAEFDNENEKSN